MFDNFNSDIHELLDKYQKNIENDIQKKIKPSVVHNHSPVRFIVIGCPYCEKYGNICK